MSNILALTAADNGSIFPLRVPLNGVRIDFTPDSHYTVGFRTEDAGSYTFSSSTVLFEQLDGTLTSSLTIGGTRLLMAQFAYDTKRNAIVLVPGSNLAGQSVPTGSTTGTTTGGTTGSTTGTIQVAGGQATSLAYGATPTVATRTVNGVTLFDFGIPQGKPGINGTGGTGSGSPTTPEVILVPDASGNVTIDATQGYAFKLVLTQNIKVLNPVNFNYGDHIKLIVMQDATGGRRLTWDTNWSFVGSQPSTTPTNAGAMFKVLSDFTQDSNNHDAWMSDITPNGTVAGGYGIVTPIATIGTTPYYMMGGAAGTGAMNLVQPGQSIVVVRNGLSAEATGTLQSPASSAPGGTYAVLGQAVPANGTDQRPILALLQTDYGNGPPQGANRPAYGKALINFEAYQTTTIRDLRITGARNDDGDARGIGANGGSTLHIQNVQVTNCCNGMLSGNADFFGDITIEDSVFDSNGIGYVNTSGRDTTGSTHNIYCGRNNQTVIARRSSFTNAKMGHEFKSRTLYTTLERSYFGPSLPARALDIPNGGTLIVSDCIFEKGSNASQNNLITIGGEWGQEGDDTTRPRKYQFTNCRFINSIATSGRDVTFLCNKDPDVIVEYIDCEWIGDVTLANNTTPDTDSFYTGMVTVKGERYYPGKAPTYTFTGNPIGPRYTVGYQTTAMTPIPA